MTEPSSWQEWVTNIKSDVGQFISLYKSVYVHQEKLGCIRSELSSWNSISANLSTAKTTLTAIEIQSFHEINEQFQNLFTLCRSLTETTYLSTLLAHEIDFVRQTTQCFRTMITDHFLSLGLSSRPVCDWNSDRVELDDIEDMSQIVIKLDGILESRDPLDSDTRTKVEELLTSFESRIDPQRSIGDLSLAVDEISRRLERFSKWVIDPTDLTFHRPIARGSFGQVFLGQHGRTRQLLAIKRLHEILRTERTFIPFEREVEISTRLQHFAILPFVGFTISQPFCLITEYMSGGTLHGRLRGSGPPLNGTQLTLIALGIVSGMEYLHTEGLIHRDLKSANILLDADDNPRICDFGVSRRGTGGEQMTRYVGTPSHMAPELLSEEPYDSSVDVYAFGMMLWEMISRTDPYQGGPFHKFVLDIVNHDLRPSIPANCLSDLSELICACWARDPRTRPTFNEIYGRMSCGTFFSGSDIERVRVYVNEHTNNLSNSGTSSDTMISRTASALAKANDAKAALEAIERANSLTESAYSDREFVESVVSGMGNCGTSEVAFGFEALSHRVLANDIGCVYFIESGGSDIFSGLFLRFGASSPIEVLRSLLLLSEKGALRPSPLLLSSAVAHIHSPIREVSSSAVAFVRFTLNSGVCVSDETILTGLGRDLPSVLLSCGIEGSFAEDTLIVTKHVLENRPGCEAFFEANGAEAIGKLAESGSIGALSLIPVLLSGLSSTSTSISTSALASASTRLVSALATSIECGVGAVQSRAISCAASLLATSDKFWSVAVQERFVVALRSCLRSSGAFEGLRLCHGFLSQRHCFAAFAELEADIEMHLDSEDCRIACLAAACATRIGGRTSAVVRFVLRGLRESAEARIASAALRLAGAIGGDFFETVGAVESAARLTMSADAEVRRLSGMVLAAASAANPCTRKAIEALPKIFERLRNCADRHLMIAIANFAISPRTAVECAKHIGVIAARIVSGDADESMKQIGLTAIERIVVTPEARDEMRDVEGLTKIVGIAEEFFEAEFAVDVLRMIDAIAAIPGGRRIVCESKVRQYVEEEVSLMDIGDKRRPFLLRIQARINEE
jgi:serine/threonine protein kinase